MPARRDPIESVLAVEQGVSRAAASRISLLCVRVMGVTDPLSQNVPLEDVQYLAGHSDPRTTQSYDRRRRRVTRNIVERISI